MYLAQRLAACIGCADYRPQNGGRPDLRGYNLNGEFHHTMTRATSQVSDMNVDCSTAEPMLRLGKRFIQRRALRR